MIFEHARYFARSGKALILGGSFTMDVEHMAVEFGDRAELQHDTVQTTSLSSRLISVAENATPAVTDIRLEDVFTFEAGKSYAVRWRSISDDGSGPDISVPWAAIDNPATGADVDSQDITLTTPAAGFDRPKAGDLIVIGELGSETLDILIGAIEPQGPGQVRVKWTLYAPERFDDDGITAPARPDLNLLPLHAVPDTPVLVGVEPSDVGIALGFSQPDAADIELAGYELAFRETPDSGETADSWTEMTPLTPEARTAVFPAGTPGQGYDLRLIALGANGGRSAALTQTAVIAGEYVPPPENVVITPATATGPSGTKIPIATVTVDTVNPARLETLMIERRVNGTTPWEAPVTAPADQPVKTITGLVPGESYDFRLAWRNVRGAVTAAADRPIVSNITIPDELVGTDTLARRGDAGRHHSDRYFDH